MTDEDRFSNDSGIILTMGQAATADLVILDRVRKSFGDKIALKDIRTSWPDMRAAWAKRRGQNHTLSAPHGNTQGD
jgi:hypothetical protein